MMTSAQRMRQSSALCSAFMFVVALYFVLPGNLLPLLGWNYFGGGAEFQKLHPATFLLLAVSSLLVLLDGAFRRRCIVQLKADFAFVALALAAFSASVFAVLARGASAANLIETFALALIVRVAVVALPRKPMVQFRTFIDLLFIVGVISVLSEFALRRNIFFEPASFYDPGTGQMVTTEFRAAGIFGHPLTAAGFFSLYSILNLVAVPIRLSMGCATRLMLSSVSFLAIFPTGGRAALLVGGLVMFAFVTMAVFRSLARGSFSKAGLVFFVGSLSALALVLPVMTQLDLFEVMLARFARDEGSALSRDYAVQILLNARLEDLWLGLDQQDIASLQKQFGLVALENAWINFALVCGLVFTLPLLVTYLLFLFQSNPRYCTIGIYFVGAFQFILSNATNDLWSKNTGFATGLAIIFAFLRKDMFAVPETSGSSRRPRVTARPSARSYYPPRIAGQMSEVR